MCKAGRGPRVIIVGGLRRISREADREWEQRWGSADAAPTPWRGSHWLETERRYVMSLLYHFTEHAVFVGGKTFTPWAPSSTAIASPVCRAPMRPSPSWSTTTRKRRPRAGNDGRRIRERPASSRAKGFDDAPRNKGPYSQGQNAGALPPVISLNFTFF